MASCIKSTPRRPTEGKKCFYREETEVGRVKEFVAFHWLSPYQEREAFLLSGSAVITGRESALLWSTDSITVSVFFFTLNLWVCFILSLGPHLEVYFLLPTISSSKFSPVTVSLSLT